MRHYAASLARLTCVARRALEGFQLYWPQLSRQVCEVDDEVADDTGVGWPTKWVGPGACPLLTLDDEVDDAGCGIPPPLLPAELCTTGVGPLTADETALPTTPPPNMLGSLCTGVPAPVQPSLLLISAVKRAPSARLL